MENSFVGTAASKAAPTVGRPLAKILRWAPLPAFLCVLATLLFWLAGKSALDQPGTPYKALLGNRSALLTIEAISSIAIFLSWLAIASMIILLGRRERKRVPLGFIIPCFSLFLISSVLTHLVDAIHLWKPFFWLDGVLRLVSAIAAILTVAILPPVLLKLHRLLREADRSRLNAERFFAASESSLDAFFLLESVRDTRGVILDFRIVHVNENGARLTTYTREQLLGSLLCEVIPVNRTGGFFEQYKRVVETGESLHYEFPISADNVVGSWLSSHVIKLGDGIAITSSDITHSKEIEQELRKSLASLREAESRQRSASDRLVKANETANAGVWEWELATGVVTWDATMARLYGRPEAGNPESPSMTYSQWMQTIHPSDRPEFEAALEALVLSGKPSNLEFRIFQADDTIRYVDSSQGVVRDSFGNVIRAVGVNMDITERKQTAEKGPVLAYHDALTGLPNRELLQDRLRVCLDRSKRFRTRLGVLMIDLDAFKQANDLLGHNCADEVLRQAAARLKAQFRTVDTVGRIGGDKFIALLPDLQAVQDARRLGQKALAALNEPMKIGGREVRITASIGIAFFPDGGSDPDLLLHNADTAMYFAKQAGRNNLQVFSVELDEASAKKSRMEEILHDAIEDPRNMCEFELVYQPQVSLADGTIAGVEALIRWHSPILGTVMPFDFIPLAEDTGMIVALGEWALRTACRDSHVINRMLGRPCTMAVNLSPRQFQQHDLIDMIGNVLHEFGVDPKQLEIEITESMLVTDASETLAILKRIRNLGIGLSIDDFGTGFSSMSYITKFDIDRLKIDRSFVSDSINDLSCRTVTKAIIGLAHDLKIDVVAEGVETEEQQRFLVRNGCKYAQGYLFSRPVSLSDLPQVFQRIEEAAKPSTEHIVPISLATGALYLRIPS